MLTSVAVVSVPAIALGVLSVWSEESLCHRLLLRASSGSWSRPPAARLLIGHMISKVLLPPK